MKEPQRPPLEELVKELPEEFREEVRDFVEFLLQKRVRRERKRPQFPWAGALRDLRDRYTSVELQHQIWEWRAGREDEISR
ncbi:MAG: DUF2281 domain-containing protein [Anaerolineae bacterium]|nr:DUF2281 domain-containing protein [Anaerolineae bacterium]